MCLKKCTIPIFIIIYVSLVMASEKTICDFAYNSIIQRIDNMGNIKPYNTSEIVGLIKDIGINMTNREMEVYLEDWDDECSLISNKTLPSFKKEIIVIKNESWENPSFNLNKTFLFMNFDFSIPWWDWKGISMDEIPENINSLKYIFRYEYDTTLKLKGIRAYVILLSLFLILIITFIISFLKFRRNEETFSDMLRKI